MKCCGRCREPKALGDFHRDRSKPDGRRSICADCASKATVAWRAADDERRKARWRAEEATRRARDIETARRKARATAARRRARLRAAFVEPVDERVVWERDHGVCGICGRPADPARWHLDHVVPLVLGGSHSYANVQVSHPSCNLSKQGRALLAA